MTPYKALDTYFKVKDLQGHYDTVSSIHDYANKLSKEKNPKAKPKDLNFFENEMGKKAMKGMKNALSVYEAAQNSAPDWPANDTALFFKSWLRAAEQHGTKSKHYQNAKKNYENKCIYYGKELKTFSTRLADRRRKIIKHLSLASGMFNYNDELRKTFWKIAHIPSLLTTAEQATWVELSEVATKLKGQSGSCVSVLKKLDNANSKAMKECRQTMQENATWAKFAASDAPDADGSLKKNAKSSRPK